MSLGQQETLSLGNLDAKRDWGHARDYIEVSIRLLLQIDNKINMHKNIKCFKHEIYHF